MLAHNRAFPRRKRSPVHRGALGEESKSVVGPINFYIAFHNNYGSIFFSFQDMTTERTTYNPIQSNPRLFQTTRSITPTTATVIKARKNEELCTTEDGGRQSTHIWPIRWTNNKEKELKDSPRILLQNTSPCCHKVCKYC